MNCASFGEYLSLNTYKVRLWTTTIPWEGQ